MNKTILFVDDEKQILKALKRLFYKSEHTILLAEGGEMALEMLAANPVDMVITDMRMPGIDGHDLLVKVRSLYPQTIRIALSGYTDKKVVLSALDKNLAKIYLFKPWNNDELIHMINNMFEFEAKLKDQNLLDFISNLTHLPTIPKLYNVISELVEAEEPISEISKVIEQDPAIASRILRIANSAYFGSKTGDIKQAIMFIGLMNVKNIILSNTVYSQRDKHSKKLESVFEHSSLTNRILNDIYKKVIKRTLPNDCKSAGLLHNIGKGILIKNHEDIYDTKSKDVKEELTTLGLTHQQVGGYILNWWELPLPIVESAMFHHNPENEEIINKEVVSVVHISQYLAGIILGNKKDTELSFKALEIAKISMSDLREYCLENFDKEI